MEPRFLRPCRPGRARGAERDVRPPPAVGELLPAPTQAPGRSPGGSSHPQTLRHRPDPLPPGARLTDVAPKAKAASLRSTSRGTRWSSDEPSGLSGRADGALQGTLALAEARPWQGHPSL